MNKLDIAEDMTNNTDIKISYLQAESQQISINCLHWLVSESESVCIGYRLYQNIRTHVPRAPCPSIMGCLHALAACDGQTDFLESLINVSYRTSIIAMFYIQVQHYHSNSSKVANLLFLKPTIVKVRNISCNIKGQSIHLLLKSLWILYIWNPHWYVIGSLHFSHCCTFYIERSQPVLVVGWWPGWQGDSIARPGMIEM